MKQYFSDVIFVSESCINISGWGWIRYSIKLLLLWPSDSDIGGQAAQSPPPVTESVYSKLLMAPSGRWWAETFLPPDWSVISHAGLWLVDILGQCPPCGHQGPSSLESFSGAAVSLRRHTSSFPLSPSQVQHTSSSLSPGSSLDLGDFSFTRLEVDEIFFSNYTTLWWLVLVQTRHPNK